MLSDKILFEWLYPVGMFPTWIVEESPDKFVRFLGLILGIPWFMVVGLPLLALVLIPLTLLMLWEDA